MRRVATTAGDVLRPVGALPRAPDGALVLGLDLGLANCGWALWRLVARDAVLVDLGLWSTEKSDKRREVLASHDEMRRARELANQMDRLLNEWRDVGQPVRAVAVEAKSLPRNASSASKIGMAWGVFAAEVERRGLPVVQASPQEVRKALGLAKSASKLDVQACVFAHTAGAQAMLAAKKIVKGDWEHPVDASAAVLACQDSEILRAVRGSF